MTQNTQEKQHRQNKRTKTTSKISRENDEKEENLNFLKRLIAPARNETGLFVTGLVLALVSLYMTIAYISFFFTGRADQSLVNGGQGVNMGVDNEIENYTGALGARLAEFLINDCFGISSVLIILFISVAGVKLMRVYKIKLLKWFISCSLLLIWFSVALAHFCGTESSDFFYPGGLHGYNVNRWLESQIGAPGVWILLLVTAILFAIYLSRETINFIRKILHPDVSFGSLKQRNIFSSVEKKNFSNPEKNEEDEMPIEVTFDIDPIETSQGKENETKSDILADSNEDHVLTEETDLFVTDSATSEESEPSIIKSEDLANDEEVNMEVEVPEDDEYEGPEIEPYNPKLDLENYHYPTLDLLKRYENNAPSVNNEELKANKDRIIEVLRNFGVEIASIKATVGPTITLYEITPAPGVRIAKIRNLENDIALSLSALGIRIIAPIPGKGTIGIEVPNQHPRIVSMESILTSKKYQESEMELPVALGKTISNEVYMFDLTKAPHLLVAGATGMGKSVGLNAIVTSLMYKKHPAELKFVIIDPKKVEFSIYAPIENHFLAKMPDDGEAIITDVKKVVMTLNSLCVEMDTRYDLLKVAKVRNIKEYNEKFIARKLNPEKGHKYLPYIVVIVDEFGDLIMTAGKEVELPIARIAQLARAVGIHMIIATQRPTTNIITGTIKANFPARMAFRTSSMIDSRTILDRPGANQLIGKGDMLYLQGQDPVRVQCAFVDTPEVENIVSHIACQQSYQSAFMLPEVQMESGEEGGNIADVDMKRLDPMFEEAARLIIIHQQGSTSLIQRKFAIGYNRAGRIMDQLERAGVVGPAQGSKPREVLCQTEMDLEMIMNNLE